MALVNDDDLERVMEKAQLSSEQKQRLRDANKPPTTEARGHGAAGPDRTKVSSL